MVSSSVFFAVVSTLDIVSAADAEAVSLLQTSSNKITHAHHKGEHLLPETTWPVGYALPEAKLDDGSKVFLNNQAWSLCDKGFTPGMAYAAEYNGKKSEQKYFETRESASACVEAVKADAFATKAEFTAVTWDINEHHCFSRNQVSHNEYFSLTNPEYATRVTCMLDKLPYDDVPKTWEFWGGDKKAKIMKNALQGNCEKNQWVLGNTVGPTSSNPFLAYVELGRAGGHEPSVFVKSPTECLAMAAADDRCHPTLAGINFHFTEEQSDGYMQEGGVDGPTGAAQGQEAGKTGGLCYCTGTMGPPKFTRKNWVGIVSCMYNNPAVGEDEEEEPGPKPDKEVCKAAKTKFKEFRTQKKTSRAEIKRLRALLKAEKAKLQTAKAGIAEHKSTVKSCRR